MSDKFNILLVEDDLLSRVTLKSRLENYGQVFEAQSSSEAFELIQSKKIDIAFVDLDLEKKLVGLEILKEAVAKDIHSIILSGREDSSVIEDAYKIGCSDYLSKPFSIDSVQKVILKFSNKKNDILSKLKEVLISVDDELAVEINTLKMALFGNQPLLITGESGTGKTFIAKFFHELIGKNKPFIHLNCSEISESLIESELFGHEKGSFTGAIKNKKGLLELAHDGVLFLDEIATLPLSSQSKLLKAIEEKTFYPVGSEKPVTSNFRLVSATCEDLKELIKMGKFREDLFFRLEGYNFHLKPLRSRKADLEKMISFFLGEHKRKIIISKEALEEFKNYSWPGNVRELQKVIALLNSNESGFITANQVKKLLKKDLEIDTTIVDFESIKTLGLPVFLERLEAAILQKTLEDNGDKVRKTMQDLKLSNNAFYRIMSNIKSDGHANAK